MKRGGYLTIFDKKYITQKEYFYKRIKSGSIDTYSVSALLSGYLFCLVDHNLISEEAYKNESECMNEELQNLIKQKYEMEEGDKDD